MSYNMCQDLIKIFKIKVSRKPNSDACGSLLHAVKKKFGYT